MHLNRLSRVDSRLFQRLRYALALLTLSANCALLHSAFGQGIPDIHWMAGAHTDTVRAVAFSPNGELLLSGSYDYSARLWRASDGTLLRTLIGHT
jgi:WD40 repeat protein